MHLFVGKTLKKAVNGFQLKKYHKLTEERAKLTEDSVFQFESSDSSPDIHRCKYSLGLLFRRFILLTKLV